MDSLVNASYIFRSTQEKLVLTYGEQEATVLSRWMLEDLLGIRRTDVALRSELPVSSASMKRFEQALHRVSSGEPIQYVLGYAEFLGERLKVAPGVLIPRPETEELVLKIVQENPEAASVLDIGTGSGCIAISVAKRLTDARIFAWDVSDSALEIANANARFAEAIVDFQNVDALAAWPTLPAKIDVIVSNPPYVLESEKLEMTSNVLDHEPETALFVSDEDPLVFYRHIGTKARDYLSRGGKLYFEINEKFGKEVQLLLESLGYRRVSQTQDLQGKARIVEATL